MMAHSRQALLGQPAVVFYSRLAPSLSCNLAAGIGLTSAGAINTGTLSTSASSIAQHGGVCKRPGTLPFTPRHHIKFQALVAGRWK